MTNERAIEVLQTRLKHMRQHPPAHPACKAMFEDECEAMEMAIQGLKKRVRK